MFFGFSRCVILVLWQQALRASPLCPTVSRLRVAVRLCSNVLRAYSSFLQAHRVRSRAQAPGFRGTWRPNSSFKPTPLHGREFFRYVAFSVAAVQRCGLTQVLGRMTKILGCLAFSAVLVGAASGIIFFEVVGLIVTMPLAVVIAFLFGLPMYLLLRKLGWVSWWQVTLAGAVIVLPFAALLGPQWRFISAVILSGSSASLLFWFIGIRPNNSSKPTPLRGAA